MSLVVHALLVLVLLVPAALCQEASDAVFRAMQDELDRSMAELSIEDMPPPYFLSYRILDVESATVGARYGSVVNRDSSERSYLYIECRVGDPQFDNSNFVGSWQDIYNTRRDIVEEDDYRAIRHQIWLHTDAAYKRALENLAGKDAYLQAHPVKEQIPDFAPEESFVHVEQRVEMDVDLDEWEEEVRAAAKALMEFPSLQDWRVTYSTYAANRRYVNSEGSKHLKGARFGVIEVAATAQAEDGQRLTNFLRHTAGNGDRPPTGAALVSEVQKMASELEEMVAAPALDEYAGPVLFDDYAAAQFISQLFATQLSPARTPMTPEDWIRQSLPDPKLTGRLNRRVFPEFITVTDEPLRESWEDVKLVGHKLVDDEGVACENITLVREGRLVTLPMSRQPTKKIQESNGHAFTFENQWTVPTITNLVVETAKPRKDLVKQLTKLAGDFDSEFGLLVTRLEDPIVSIPYKWTETGDDSPPLVTSPVVMYKVYAKDGRVEPARGLVFDEVSIRSLRDITALGKDALATNLLQPLGVEGVYYPAAIVTPDILVEEMELTASSVHEPMPLSERPVVGM